MGLRSMTGFGIAEGELSGRLRATVRLASVNARSLEVVLRSQPRLDPIEWEPVVRDVGAGDVTRGRVTVAIHLEGETANQAIAACNWRVAEALAAEVEQRRAVMPLATLSLRDLLAIPGFFEGAKELQLAEDERAQLVALVQEACQQLVATRVQEGAALQAAMEKEVEALAAFVAWIKEQAPRVTAALLARLRQRLSELLGGTLVSEARLLEEAAIAAERADVAEEVARLEAHLEHLRRLSAAAEPMGKRVEFLLQEVLREVNTAASKFREVGMGERVVAAKAAVERLREQAANIE